MKSSICAQTTEVCNLNVFTTDNPHKRFMLNSIVYRANQLWQTLPAELKDRNSLRTKSKLGIVLDVSVKLTEHT